MQLALGLSEDALGVSVRVQTCTRCSNGLLCGSKLELRDIRMDDWTPACPMQLVPGRSQHGCQQMRIIIVAQKCLQGRL